MPKIVFDIETAGEDFDQMDQATKEYNLGKLEKKSNGEEELKKELEKFKEETVFSPLTAEIVAIGVLDAETKKGAVYYQEPEEKNTNPKEKEPALRSLGEAWEEEGIKFKPQNEKEMLESFWKVVGRGQEFISFNGRSFDVPFLMIRSAIHKIRPSKNLLANRYMNLQPHDAKHVDLMDQLNFYGATWGKMNLHMACRAFGIKSPKEEGINGDDVTRLFREKKYLDIARYNARDLRSTGELYEYWNKYLRF